MGYRSIIIAGGCRLSVKNEQLVIKADEEHSVPIEDIRTLMIENQASVITAYALTELSKAGVCVFFCDEKHLPCAFLQPFAQYTRRKQRLFAQLSMSKPAVKRLWQSIVTAKIDNQAKTLELCHGAAAECAVLRALGDKVRSGDPDNIEGQAAARYFRALFGRTFSRAQEENVINKALNYGYAIVRGYICRQLADYGFEPCIGLHHVSGVNNFNLADDLIESFRPLIDLFVFQNVKEKGEKDLSPALKNELTNILNYEVISGSERHSMAYAIERLVHSLEWCLDNGQNAKSLLLPSFDQLARHEYA